VNLLFEIIADFIGDMIVTYLLAGKNAEHDRKVSSKGETDSEREEK